MPSGTHLCHVLLTAALALDAVPGCTAEGNGTRDKAGAAGAGAGFGDLGGAGPCQEFCRGPDAGIDADRPFDAGAIGDAALPDAQMDAAAAAPPAVAVGDAALPDTLVDAAAAAPDAGSDAGAWEACLGPEPELLVVPQAGTGALSGCPELHCAGIDLAASNASWDYPSGTTNLAPFAGCTRIDGDLAVANHPSADLSVLSCLEHVTGDVLIWNSAALTSLHGLESLQQVDGDFDLGFHDALHVGLDHVASLAALSNLRAIGGELAISQMPLTTLHGLEALRAVGGDVYIAFLSLQNLQGLSALRVVGGSFLLWRCEGMTGTAGAEALSRVAEGFSIRNATSLQVLDGFSGLRCIGGSLELTGEGDPNQEALTRIDGLAGLRYVGGNVQLARYARLQSAALFSAGPYVGHELAISDNPQLSELPGLVDVAGPSLLAVANNPKLPECTPRQLGDALLAADPTTTVNISGNQACP